VLVDSFPYLGLLATENAECATEIKAKLSEGQCYSTNGKDKKPVWENYSNEIYGWESSAVKNEY
jgi:hypothetical protein